MVFSFELSLHRRVQVWLDEAPPTPFEATSVVTRMVKPSVSVDPSHRVAGVELFVPYGPRASYALLAAELIDADIEDLEVAVSVAAAGLAFQPSLATKPEDVRVGLLDEYAGAVLDGAAGIAARSGAPTKSKLLFRWAAHGLVGSSQSSFKAAAELVLQLLTMPDPASRDRIAKLF